MPLTCDTITRAPYVCNACPNERSCRMDHYLYQARHAQREYEKTLVKSREGINMTPEELQELNNLISPLVLRGQPLSHIFAVHGDEIPVCRRTLYNYFDQRIFNARNIDLPRRVRYKKRMKRSEPRKKNVQQTYWSKRTFIDFEKYTAALASHINSTASCQWNILYICFYFKENCSWGRNIYAYDLCCGCRICNTQIVKR